VNKYALGWSSYCRGGRRHASPLSGEAWPHPPQLENFSIDSIVRITARHKRFYNALKVNGDAINCHVSGKSLQDLSLQSQFPAVGDWCVVGETFLDESNQPAAVIEHLLPRRSKISRLVAGAETDEQILASNIDLVLILTSVNSDFSINRLRRYVLLAQHGQAQPVIVLSKIDLAAGREWEILEDVQSHFPEVECIIASAVSMIGITPISDMIASGKTAVFVGSSGVGKSTLVNKLLANDIQKIASVRDQDGKGRHTTSGSNLFFTSNGGIIIDTAGLREVQLVGNADDLRDLMPDIHQLAGACKFSDCTHTNEPDCAVLDAINAGSLHSSDLAAYKRMDRELAFARRRLDQKLESAERKRWKKIAVQNRQRKNDRQRN
jgi:ribosome biogenesis GTPase / thiamine phosphate phosphatase